MYSAITKNLCVCTLTLGLLTAAKASVAMSWSELAAEIDSVEAGNPPNLALIWRTADMIEMLVTYYKALPAEGNGRLFCTPANGSMNIDQVVSMIRKQARDQSAGGEMPVQQLLLDAFVEEFPCQK